MDCCDLSVGDVSELLKVSLGLTSTVKSVHHDSLISKGYVREYHNHDCVGYLGSWLVLTQKVRLYWLEL